MGGVNQDFSGGLAEPPLIQHSKGRVHHGELCVFGTSCASEKLLLPPPDRDFGMWISFGAQGCLVLLGTRDKTRGIRGKSGKEEEQDGAAPLGMAFLDAQSCS